MGIQLGTASIVRDEIVERIKLAIIYYSATGTNYRLALAARAAAEQAGAEVRLRKVHELAPDAAIDRNPAWPRASEHVTRGKVDRCP